MHLVMAFPNVFFHDLRPMATMEPLARGDDGKAVLLDELDLESFGAVKYSDFTWRDLIDGWACTSCARCQDVCPAYASGKDLNPMQIIHDVRHYANDHATTLFADGHPRRTSSPALAKGRYGRAPRATPALRHARFTSIMFRS